MNNDRFCLRMVNCNSCGGNTPTPSGGDTPVGHILAYMGTKAPVHYLICDGAELNIADYPSLTAQIMDEFGSINYFGGDGTTTFAVPDLRNEFLRGFHGAAADQMSGEVGVHQKPTQVPHVWVYNQSDGSRSYLGGDCYTEDLIKSTFATDFDSGSFSKPNRTYIMNNIARANTEHNDSIAIPTMYSARPTNTAVLYCIKYE